MIQFYHSGLYIKKNLSLHTTEMLHIHVDHNTVHNN